MNTKFILIFLIAVIFLNATLISAKVYPPELKGPYFFVKYSDKFNVTNLSYDIFVYTPIGVKPLAFEIKGPPYPVVIVSPGLGASKMDYRWIGEHLASHGFVVILYSVPNRFAWGVSERVDGFKEAINYLELKNNQKWSPLKGKVDLSKIEISGHSLGGGASVAYIPLDSRVKTAVLLAPYLGSVEGNLTLINIPVQLQIGDMDSMFYKNETDLSDDNDSTPYDYYKNLSTQTKEYIQIKGGNHFQYSESPISTLGSFLDCKANISQEMQQRIALRYLTSWSYYFLKNDSNYYTYLFGETVVKNLNNQSISMLDIKIPSLNLSMGSLGKGCVNLMSNMWSDDDENKTSATITSLDIGNFLRTTGNIIFEFFN